MTTTRRRVRGRVVFRRHHRTLTPKQVEMLALASQGLDTLTEFGLESASRERLLLAIGSATTTLRLLRERIGDG